MLPQHTPIIITLIGLFSKINADGATSCTRAHVGTLRSATSAGGEAILLGSAEMRIGRVVCVEEEIFLLVLTIQTMSKRANKKEIILLIMKRILLRGSI